MNALAVFSVKADALVACWPHAHGAEQKGRDILRAVWLDHGGVMIATDGRTMLVVRDAFTGDALPHAPVRVPIGTDALTTRHLRAIANAARRAHSPITVTLAADGAVLVSWRTLSVLCPPYAVAPDAVPKWRRIMRARLEIDRHAETTPAFQVTLNPALLARFGASASLIVGASPYQAVHVRTSNPDQWGVIMPMHTDEPANKAMPQWLQDVSVEPSA